jgi:hypothetical protein
LEAPLARSLFSHPPDLPPPLSHQELAAWPPTAATRPPRPLAFGAIRPDRDAAGAAEADHLDAVLAAVEAAAGGGEREEAGAGPPADDEDMGAEAEEEEEEHDEAAVRAAVAAAAALLAEDEGAVDEGLAEAA